MKTTTAAIFDESRCGRRLAPGQPGKVSDTLSPAAAAVQALAPEIIALAATATELDILEQVVAALPPRTAPIIVTLDPVTAMDPDILARLDRKSRLRVTLARQGDPLVPGRVLVAPGDHSITITRCAGTLLAVLEDDPLCTCQRPCADVMFRAAAVFAGHRAIGVLLGGTERDGVAGLLELRRRGARTIVLEHDPWASLEAPGEAIRLGAASEVLTPRQITSVICSFLTAPPGASEHERAAAATSRGRR